MGYMVTPMGDGHGMTDNNMTPIGMGNNQNVNDEEEEDDEYEGGGDLNKLYSKPINGSTIHNTTPWTPHND